METKEYCAEVTAVRTHIVSNQKPVPVTVYDYYDQSEYTMQAFSRGFAPVTSLMGHCLHTARRARVFYEPPPADVADKGQ